MQIFAVYKPEDAKILRIWADSWRAAGWRPRLLLPKHARTRKMRVVAPRLINFGLRPSKKAVFRPKQWGFDGWRESKLVIFPPEATEEHIFNCGRPFVK